MEGIQKKGGEAHGIVIGREVYREGRAEGIECDCLMQVTLQESDKYYR